MHADQNMLRQQGRVRLAKDTPPTSTTILLPGRHTWLCRSCCVALAETAS